LALLAVLNLAAFAAVAARPAARTWLAYALVNALFLLTGLFAAFTLVDLAATA
jgi:hypothetical protein